MSIAAIFNSLPEALKKYIENSGKFPTLYTKVKRGSSLKDHYWKITVNEDDEGRAYISTVHGDVGGKPSIPSVEIFKKGKNEGKINETSTYEQAFNEAKSKFAKKFKANAFLSEDDMKKIDLKLEDLNNKFFPMLAYKYEENRVKFPIAGSPKLDGVRCIAMRNEDGTVTLNSREMTEISGYPLIHKELESISTKLWPSTCYLDGEIYAHNINFEKISGYSRKKDLNELSTSELDEMNNIQYHIFDIYCTDKPDMIFKDRYAVVKKIFAEYKFKTLKIVPTFVFKNKEAIEVYLEKFVNEGYEGLILRNLDSTYKVSGRSTDLLKVKKTDKTWVTILAIDTGKEIKKPNIIFSVIDSYGIKFSVTANSTEEYRSKILDNKNSYIGKKLLITYNGVTKKNIPKFARIMLDENNEYIME